MASDVEISRAFIGQYGAKQITSTTAVTPDTGLVFVCLITETDTVINATS